MKLITPTCFFFVFQVLVDFPHHISIAQVPALVILPATDLLDFIYVTHKYKANVSDTCRILLFLYPKISAGYWLERPTHQVPVEKMKSEGTWKS
jgi:hypothetical protein